MKRALTSVALSLIVWGQSAAQAPLETVEVVGQTPLGGSLDADSVAGNVQRAGADDLEAQRALDLADFMRRNLASVFVNEAQSNPLQPDVQYRGFVGSPLLGLPQGLAVYQDGVRINEPFGDTVNWALIPESAIETVYLMPGSNPLFGLNALGGAIAVETKDGFSSDGTSAEIYGGSFSRVGIEADTGGSVDDRFSYFVSGSYLDEDGWRDFSPTEALRVFTNLGWQGRSTSIDVSLTYADTTLIGNGAAPADLIRADRSAIFTHPDETANELALVNLTAEHEVSSTLVVTGNVYMRRSDIATYNGDDSDFEECVLDPGFVCEADEAGEELVLDPAGAPIAFSDAVEGATVNRTSTRQDGTGFGFQAEWTGDVRSHENSFVIGVAYDASDIGFDASSELGALDDTRRAVPSGSFIGDSFTRLSADTSNLGLYLSDTLGLSDRLALTLSGRYNRTRIDLHDEIGTALEGSHEFTRFNPAIGLTARLSEAIGFYVGYSESSRAPSPVELTCADEDDPCRLPNAFLADPPLEQVVAETVEAGIRGRWSGGGWHAGVFRTTNLDDILFVSAGVLTNQGYFDNVGRTRRNGIELDVDGNLGERGGWFANYTLLDASFREHIVFPSPNNPANVGGEVAVDPGDRLPLISRWLLKAGLRIPVGPRASIGLDLLAGSSFHLRGDEGNDVAGIGAYGLLNLRGEYSLSDRVQLFLDIDNVLDEEYETFGLFGEARDVLGDGYEDGRFLSPAQPRAAWIGVRLQF